MFDQLSTNQSTVFTLRNTPRPGFTPQPEAPVQNNTFWRSYFYHRVQLSLSLLMNNVNNNEVSGDCKSRSLSGRSALSCSWTLGVPAGTNCSCAMSLSSPAASSGKSAATRGPGEQLGHTVPFLIRAVNKISRNYHIIRRRSLLWPL